MQIGRYYKYFIGFSLLVISFWSCKKVNKTPELGTVVKKTLTVDSTASKYLGQIYPLIAASSAKDRIAISNVRNPIGVVEIDYEGNFIARYGSRGKGPKELLSARFFGFDQQYRMNIYDKSLGLIKRFDSSSDSVNSFQSPIKEGISITTQLFEQCDSSWILGIAEMNENNRTLGKSSIIGKFDDEFNVVQLFGKMDPFFNGKRSVLSNTITSIDCKNNLIYSSHAKVPFIQIYNLKDFSRVDRIDHTPASFKLSDNFMPMVSNMQEYRDFVINEQSASIFLAQTKKYILLPFRNETSEFFTTRNYNARKHYLAVFSKKERKFIDEIPLDHAPVGATKEGYIITLLNDNPDNFQINLLKIVNTESM